MRRLFVLLLLLSSCHGVLTRPADSLVTSLPGEPTSLNPIIATDAGAHGVLGHVYESMLDLDIKTLHYKPLLAESWEVADDHLTYTFHLRHGVQWQDGAPFTADDVVFTFKTILDPNIHAEALRSNMGDVLEVKKLDEFTVQARYREPYFRVLEIIGFVPILPKHIFEKGDFHQNPANSQPIGTGPYRLTKYHPHQSIVLQRFAGYWGEKPVFERLILQVIPDKAVSFFQLRKGALDDEELTPLQWRRKAQTPAFQKKWATFRYYQPNFSAVAWNLRNEKLKDLRVRKALAMAFNREEFLASTMMGEGKTVIGSFYGDTPYYAHDIQPLPYDPAQARQLLAEAGWKDTDGDGWLDKNGQIFSLNFFYPQSSTKFRSFALVYQSELKKLGIELNLRELEWTTMLDFMEKRDFEAVGIGWRLPLEQDPYQLWHSSQAEHGSNVTGFSNAEVDELLVSGRREFDLEKRVQTFHRLQEILYEEQPYFFLYSTPTFEAVSKRLNNLILYPLGLEPDKWGVATLDALPVW